MFLNSTKALEFSRLSTIKSGKELRKLKKYIAWSILVWKPDEKQATSIMHFFSLSFNMEQAKGLVNLLFLSIKYGLSNRIFFVFRYLFEQIYQSF